MAIGYGYKNKAIASAVFNVDANSPASADDSTGAPIFKNRIEKFTQSTGANPVDGEALFIVPGTYSWTCPAGVTSVNVVCVGGGAGGGGNGGSGGGGGGLGYKNNIAVTPGQTYTVVVGAGGSENNNGQISYFNSTSTVAGYGGYRGFTGKWGTGGDGQGYVGDGGGFGGDGGAGWYTYFGGGGGGAGGYGGNGGNGGRSGNYSQTGNVSVASENGTNGNFGAGGGGAGAGSAGNLSAGTGISDSRHGGGGGGTGLYGQGEDGLGGTWAGGYTTWFTNGGGGGSTFADTGTAGANSINSASDSSNGGFPGGGGGARGGSKQSTNSYRGGDGAVRIFWGSGSFPNDAGAGSTPGIFNTTGAITIQAQGNGSKAMQFPGTTGSYINLGKIFNDKLKRATIEIWFKSAENIGSTRFMCMMGWGEGNANYSNISIGNWYGAQPDESIHFGLNSATIIGAENAGHSKYHDQQWHLATVTLGVNEYGIYVDGENKALTYPNGSASTDVGDLFSFGNANCEAWIGNRPYGGGGAPWNGWIGNVTIYDRVLTAEEIKTNYQATRGRYE